MIRRYQATEIDPKYASQNALEGGERSASPRIQIEEKSSCLFRFFQYYHQRSRSGSQDKVCRQINGGETRRPSRHSDSSISCRISWDTARAGIRSGEETGRVVESRFVLFGFGSEMSIGRSSKGQFAYARAKNAGRIALSRIGDTTGKRTK